MSWSISELRVRLAPLNRFKPSNKIFYWPFQGGTSFVDLLCFCSVLRLLCLCAHLFICALWSPAGKVLTSWLSFVVSNCEFVTFPLVSWVRCGAWLYQFLIFAPVLTLIIHVNVSSSDALSALIKLAKANCAFNLSYDMAIAIGWIDCCVALPRSAMGLSAVCDCGISWSYSLFFIVPNSGFWCWLSKVLSTERCSPKILNSEIILNKAHD